MDTISKSEVELSPEQVKIRDEALQQGSDDATANLLLWCGGIFVGSFLLLALILPRNLGAPVIYWAITLSCASAASWSFYKFRGDAIKKGAIDKRTEEYTCGDCGAQFALKLTKTSEKKTGAVPRSSQQMGHGGEDHKKQSFHDVITTQWTEEHWEITKDFRCVVCENTTQVVTNETRETNRSSSSVRQYH